MRSNENKVVEFSPKSDDYDAFMLDFLEREATAPGKPSQAQRADEDELDSMVSDFLREAASLEAETQVNLGTGGPAAPESTAGVSTQSPPASTARVKPATEKGKQILEGKSLSPRPPIFAAAAPERTGKKYFLAAGSIFLLAAVGIGSYRFLSPRVAGGKDSVQDPKPVAARPAEDTPAAVQPATPMKQLPPVSSAEPKAESAALRPFARGASVANPGENRIQADGSEKTDRTTPKIAEKVAQPTEPAPPTTPPPESKVIEAAQTVARQDPAPSAPPVEAAQTAQPAVPVPALPLVHVPAKLVNNDRPAPPASRSVSPSVTVSRTLPRYPAAAWQMKVSGTVEVEAQVDEYGRVVNARAVKGPQLLQAAAVEAVRKWKFKPATLNGANVSSVAQVSVVFKRE